MMENNGASAQDLDARLARMETILEILYTELKGNGQPGFIAEVRGRVGALETLAARGKGALAVLGTLITAISGTLVHLWGKHS